MTNNSNVMWHVRSGVVPGKYQVSTRIPSLCFLLDYQSPPTNTALLNPNSFGMRFWLYCLVSSAIFGAMLLDSMLMYPNYFSSLVGIPDSAIKACIVINFAGCIAALWFKFVVAVFLGPLTSHELQSVYQRGWMFFCNSLLFWGTSSIDAHINSYNLGIGILAGLTLLVLHWLCRSRVQGLQALDLSNLSLKSAFKTFRLATLCLILGFVDVGLCQVALEKFRRRDFSLYFAIFVIDLSEMCINFCGELIVNLLAIRYLIKHEEEDEWDKSNLLADLVHIAASFSGIAAHFLITSQFGIWKSDIGSIAMRTLRAYKNTTKLWKTLTAKSELEKFTVPATEEELQRDNICVICREEMFISDAGHKRKAARKLGCGHIMHSGCLASWMTRSQNCPTCRQPVQSAASSFRQEEQAAAAAATTTTTNTIPAAVETVSAAQNAQNHGPELFTAEDTTNATRDVSMAAGTHGEPAGGAHATAGPNAGPEPHVSEDLESVLTRARERVRYHMSTLESNNVNNDPTNSMAARSTASSTTTTTTASRLAEDRKTVVPVSFQMTGDTSGVLADRYKFVFQGYSA